jgi:hypothetical protein
MAVDGSPWGPDSGQSESGLSFAVPAVPIAQAMPSRHQTTYSRPGRLVLSVPVEPAPAILGRGSERVKIKARPGLLYQHC